MLPTETLYEKKYIMDIMGVCKKYTYLFFRVRTAFVKSRSLALRSNGFLRNDYPDVSNNTGVRTTRA